MKTLGIAIVVLALLVAAVPAFNNCSAEGKLITTAAGKQIPMKCYWSAQAEIGVALPLALLGGMVAINRRRETRKYLAGLGVALGLVVMALPTFLIGVCADMTASCNLIMRPAMLFVGTLVVAVSLAVYFLSSRADLLDRGAA